MVNELVRVNLRHFCSHSTAEPVSSHSHADALRWHHDQVTDGMPRYRWFEQVLPPFERPRFEVLCWDVDGDHERHQRSGLLLLQGILYGQNPPPRSKSRDEVLHKTK